MARVHLNLAVIAGKPSAYVPVMMSLAAMLLVISVVGTEGAAARQPDEGTAAHVFQLLVVAQLPIIGLFAWTWLPRDRRAACFVLAGQVAAMGLALLPVWAFGL